MILFPIVIAAPMITPAAKPLGFVFMGHEVFPRYGFDTWPYFEFPILFVIGETILFCLCICARGIRAALTLENPPKKWEWKILMIVSIVWVISSVIPLILGIVWVLNSSIFTPQALWMLLGSLGILAAGGIFYNIFRAIYHHCLEKFSDI